MSSHPSFNAVTENINMTGNIEVIGKIGETPNKLGNTLGICDHLVSMQRSSQW